MAACTGPQAVLSNTARPSSTAAGASQQRFGPVEATDSWKLLHSRSAVSAAENGLQGDV